MPKTEYNMLTHNIVFSPLSEVEDRGQGKYYGLTMKCKDNLNCLD